MRRRRTAAVGVVALVAALAGSAYVLLPPRQSADVAVPPASAAPEDVVRAYLAALDAHDCETARAVSDDPDRATTWCDDLAGLDDVRVREPFEEDPAWSGRDADEEVVDVPVTVDLDWRPFHRDGSLPGGRTTWGYLLARDSPSDPWRIVDSGTG